MHCNAGRKVKGLSTLYFFGKMSPIPGTLGSLIGMIVGIFLLYYCSLLIFLSFLILLFIISYISISLYTSDPKRSGHDPTEVIIDEFLGQLISMIPIFTLAQGIKSLLIYGLISFILFRFFDIVKPWPISYFDNMKNPLGVILDDILAGTISALILFFLFSQ